MGYAGGAAGAVAAAIAEAIKASGAIVRVEPRDFMAIIDRAEKPLVVICRPSFWSRSFKYISSYKGLAFHTKSSAELRLPGNCELITAKDISVPS